MRALKHQFDKDPSKRQEWKDAESNYTNTYRWHRREEKKGNLTKVVNQEDMVRLTKFAKTGRTQGVSMIKNGKGEIASSPEESISNLCDAHFPGSKCIEMTDIQANITKKHNMKGIKNVIRRGWVNETRI